MITVDTEEEDEEAEEVKILREAGSFDSVVLWGHETLVEADDALMKGLGEWIGFAEAVRTPFLAFPRSKALPRMLTKVIDAQAGRAERMSEQ